MLTLVVGWLLQRANAAPPRIGREAFYRLKSRLLTQFGERIGVDYQHIVKPCWDGPCPRCGGTGIWSEISVQLDRWQVGPWVFHHPVRRLLAIPAEAKTTCIEGYIRHASYGRLSEECALLLALFFDRALFWTLLRYPSTRAWSWWPLHIVQQLVHRIGRAWTAYGPAECWRCGHTFIGLWAGSPDPNLCGHCHFICRFLDSLPGAAARLPF